MRQVFLDKGSIAVKEVSRPMLDDFSVLVAVHYSFVSSGTEIATISNARSGLFSNVPNKVKKVLRSVSMHGIDGTTALIKGKLKGEVSCLGYSCSGQVLAVGKKVKHFKEGDLVACAGAGYAHHADIVCVPEHLAVKIHDENYVRAASITTIGAIALQGIRRAQVQIGERVCVFGLGLLGQLTVQLAKLSGCQVIGIDIVPERLALAEKLGAQKVYHAMEDNVQKEIALFTEHCGIDVSLITAASTSNIIIQQAMEITRAKGRVVIVGDVGLKLERDPFYKKEIDLLMSCSYGPGRYDSLYEEQGQDYPYAYVRWTENRNMQAFIKLIEQGALDIDALVSREVTLDSIQEIYEHIQKKELLGVVLKYTPEQCIKKESEKDQIAHTSFQSNSEDKELRFKPAVTDLLRVGIIGAGGFAKIKLMPLVSRLDNATISAVVDADIANSLNVCRLYGISKAFVKDDELFKNDLVDVVVIASPHKFHCNQALKALKNGKAVFLEKPMVTDFEQLKRFESFLTLNPNVPFGVDYNRSFSPFMRRIKKILNTRTTPLMLNYRMNAGYISKEHWVQTEVGAGRIIGEACHILDLFLYLTDAQPTAVSVEVLLSDRDDLFPTDNFSVQLSFTDGSVCSLMYTALGHEKLAKEHMEIFFDAKTIVMEDFVTLTGYGLPSWFSEINAVQDKGHETFIFEFFNALKQPTFEPPIPFARLLRVAHLTLLIDQLACEGGGSLDFKVSQSKGMSIEL